MVEVTHALPALWCEILLLVEEFEEPERGTILLVMHLGLNQVIVRVHPVTFDVVVKTLLEELKEVGFLISLNADKVVV